MTITLRTFLNILRALNLILGALLPLSYMYTFDVIGKVPIYFYKYRVKSYFNFYIKLHVQALMRPLSKCNLRT